MRTFLFSIFISAISFPSCSQTNSRTTGDHLFSYDTSRLAILKYDTRFGYPFDSTCQAASLTNDELHRLDSLIRREIGKHNKRYDPKSVGSFGVDTMKYKYRRQYIAAVNGRGEKVVWANFFCRDAYDKWKQQVVYVFDGGNCYFYLVVNLATGKCNGISVNGYASQNNRHMDLAENSPGNE